MEFWGGRKLKNENKLTLLVVVIYLQVIDFLFYAKIAIIKNKLGESNVNLLVHVCRLE